MRDAMEKATRPKPDTLRVLLVEDDEACRETLRLLLTMEGAGVVATSSGCRAARLAREEQFDLIFTEFHLRDVPGAMLIREFVTACVARPHIAVFTSGGDADVVAAREAGAEVVLRKPLLWGDIMLYLSKVTPSNETVAA
jgi:DNA-binding response OmpR family regulator